MDLSRNFWFFLSDQFLNLIIFSQESLILVKFKQIDGIYIYQSIKSKKDWILPKFSSLNFFSISQCKQLQLI